MTVNLARTKRQSVRRKLMTAYESYKKEEPGSLDGLLTAVRSFAYLKLYHLEYEFKEFGTADTVDDWAQDVAIKVWEELDTNMKPDTFYAWVHKIAYNRGVDAFNALLLERSQRSGITMMIEGDEGLEEIDNPEIYEDNTRDSDFRVPKEITGINRDICSLLLSQVSDGNGGMRNRTYSEVGEILGISENAVNMRIRKMRKKFKRFKRSKQ